MNNIITQLASVTQYEASQIGNVTVNEQRHWVDFTVNGAHMWATLSKDNKRVFSNTVRISKGA
jgi:hypothetical protein